MAVTLIILKVEARWYYKLSPQDRLIKDNDGMVGTHRA